MGFIGKLLSGVSAAVLMLVGGSGAGANTPPQGAQQEKQLLGVLGGAGDLLAGFIVETGARYSEDAAEAAIRRMFDGMSADRVLDLPKFVRGLRSLRLSPEVEVAAVETLISMLEEVSGSLISEEQAAAVTGQIFDQFVEPIRVAQGQGDDPSGKFSDRGDFPGSDRGFSQGEKEGQPFGS